MAPEDFKTQALTDPEEPFSLVQFPDIRKHEFDALV